VAKTFPDATGVSINRVAYRVVGDIYDTTGSASVSIEARYSMTDVNGDIISGVAGDVVVVNDTAANLDSDSLSNDVVAALQTLETWLNSLAVIKEGI
jgi:hypothetical protein